MSDKDASEIIKKISKCENTTEFQLIEQKQRDKYIKKLKQNGLSIRQISRLTGVSKGIVEKIQKTIEPSLCLTLEWSVTFMKKGLK